MASKRKGLVKQNFGLVKGWVNAKQNRGWVKPECIVISKARSNIEDQKAMSTVL